MPTTIGIKPTNLATLIGNSTNQMPEKKQILAKINNIHLGNHLNFARINVIGPMSKIKRKTSDATKARLAI